MQPNDIIQRLETATGPCRELDGRIWCYVNGYEFIAWDGAGCRYRAKQPGWISSDYIKKWTASIDAAMTLVSEGWRLHILCEHYGKWSACFHRTFGTEQDQKIWLSDHHWPAKHSVKGKGFTAACAVSSAALKAIEATERDNGGN